MDKRDLPDANRAKDAATANNVVHHDNHPSAGDQVGEAAGGISGVLTGAALGSVGGPIGTIIGGIAGAVGGWWAGRAISEAAGNFTNDDDTHYRGRYEGSTNRVADRGYDDVRPAYQLGHVAANNPDYKDRTFTQVEGDLKKGWTDDMRSRHGEWDTVKGYTQDAYDYNRGRLGNAAARAEKGVEHLADKTKRVADDMHDRVDGNPASKPGPDVTDKRF